MALEGTFKDFPATDIFQLIGLQRKTGILFLESGQRQIKIFISEGKVIWAEDNQRNPEARLGQLLVNTGKIQKEQLEEALIRQSQTKQRLGSILLQMNYLKGQELETTLEHQVVETAFQVFRWKEGQYLFSAQRNPDPSEHLIAPLPVESILLDAMRMIDEWPLIEDKIPSFENYLYKAPHLSNSMDKNRLREEEWVIFNSIDGTKRVRDIIDTSPLNEFDTCKIIAGLISGGFLATQKPPLETVPGKAILPVAGERQRVLPRIGSFLLLPAVALAWIAIHLFIIHSDLSPLIPFSPPREKSVELARVYQARLEMEEWHDAVRLFYAEWGDWPFRVKGMESSRTGRRLRARDPWGNYYRYRVDENGFRLASSGGDRIAGTSDDIERREAP